MNILKVIWCEIERLFLEYLFTWEFIKEFIKEFFEVVSGILIIIIVLIQLNRLYDYLKNNPKFDKIAKTTLTIVLIIVILFFIGFNLYTSGIQNQRCIK